MVGVYAKSDCEFFYSRRALDLFLLIKHYNPLLNVYTALNSIYLHATEIVSNFQFITKYRTYSIQCVIPATLFKC